MDNQDRQAIEGLFSRLDTVERQAGQRDAEAEAFINQRLVRQPGAPYFMAQTIVMQEYALQQAQERISQMEQQAQAAPQAGGGGFLSSLFGGGSAPRGSGSVPSVPRSSPFGQQGMPQRGPGGAYQDGSQMPPQMGQAQPGRGGGFLAGAAQTAMGVAGGMLLGSAVASMFSGGEAQAAEPSAAEPAAEPDAGAADDGGGFFDSLGFGGEE